jgi:glucan phosphorylase
VNLVWGLGSAIHLATTATTNAPGDDDDDDDEAITKANYQDDSKGRQNDQSLTYSYVCASASALLLSAIVEANPKCLSLKSRDCCCC